eukprot:1149945-Pelagomonas_calceolata.AAC.3
MQLVETHWETVEQWLPKLEPADCYLPIDLAGLDFTLFSQGMIGTSTPHTKVQLQGEASAIESISCVERVLLEVVTACEGKHEGVHTRRPPSYVLTKSTSSDHPALTVLQHHYVGFLIAKFGEQEVPANDQMR